jgi:superfamily II DNA or RNA helicase
MNRRDRLADLLRRYGGVLRVPRIDDPPPPGSSLDPYDEDDDPTDETRPTVTWQPGTRPLTWREHLAALRHALAGDREDPLFAWPHGRELLYVVDITAAIRDNGLVLEICYRDPRKQGGFTQVRRLGARRESLRAVVDPADQRALALLGGARDADRLWMDGYSSYGTVSHRYLVPADLYETVLPLVCGTGRCHVRTASPEPVLSPLAWDDGPAWVPSIDVQAAPRAGHYVVTGYLRRGDERIALSTPRLLLAGGVVILADRIARLEDGGAFPWIAHLRQHGPLRVPQPQGAAFVATLLGLARVPRLHLPEELRYEELSIAPRPRLRVRPAPPLWGPTRLRAALSFDYDGIAVPADREGLGAFDVKQRRFLKRDRDAEAEAARRLKELGFGRRPLHGHYGARSALAVATRDFPRAIGLLVAEGWHVEADGKLYRQPGPLRLDIVSGLDWFELHGTVDFGGTTARLPELLAALRRRDRVVLLGDGTYGVLLEEWLRRYRMLGDLGAAAADHLRFGRNQIGLLDALLGDAPEARPDALFVRAREELRRFTGVEPREAPPGFIGQLRGYQRDGLGWLSFLQRFGFGGCLADDMGLGKTVQVLALLESRREAREAAKAAGESVAAPGPTLVVVPRSLVFNWRQEAARFTPKLRVLEHAGAGRPRAGEHFEDYDLVLTTYGTLRRDALLFKDVRFDYVILDEAQAIKNAATESAKAARLLRGEHRLALSGTPVQNHLGELGSLFEFLNPGMLGAGSLLNVDGPLTRTPDADTLELLTRGLRPFILRRTKEQVAPDLPARTLQTLSCELDPDQRRLYDELRGHYRAALLDRIGRHGIRRSKIQVLEALLRLRQAACHPGLIDRARVGEPSAKLDVLLPHLAEVREEGHKALVFSQFTSLLAIVRARLDQERVPYEYLDGRTRDRAARVERFQTDPECLLFLVSLTAGGLGLNLTAAEYVFLLDPWWNPAVEAQAIDRTHRIGQTRPVFAYRLIARDTVEEKVLELQETKRALADSIITADESLIRSLSRDDLELLLS